MVLGGGGGGHIVHPPPGTLHEISHERLELRTSNFLTIEPFPNQGGGGGGAHCDPRYTSSKCLKNTLSYGLENFWQYKGASHKFAVFF